MDKEAEVARVSLRRVGSATWHGVAQAKCRAGVNEEMIDQEIDDMSPFQNNHVRSSDATKVRVSSGAEPQSCGCCTITSALTVGGSHGRLLGRLVKLSTLMFAVACVAGSSAALAADKLPKAEVIVDNFIKASGGKAALEKFHNRVIKAELELIGVGMKLDVTIYQAEGDSTLTITNSEMTGEIRQGVNGGVVWGTSLMEGPHLKKGKEKETLLLDSKWNAILEWRELYEKVECIALESIEGKPCYKVVMTPKAGSPRTMYFDKESFLPSKLEMIYENQMGQIPVERFIRDYREVDGIMIPHKAEIKAAGSTRVFMVKSVEHDVALPKDFLKLPAEIQALVDKEEDGKAPNKKP